VKGGSGEQHRVPASASADIAGRPERFDRLDALRGLAIVWMAGFHFSFDLNHFGLIRQNFYTDPTWTLQRGAIVSLFLFCAGLGQAIAADQRQPWARFGRRWLRVAGCALLVTLGSLWMFPRSFISFGVLHGMALMLVLVRLGATRTGLLWALGLLAIVLPWTIQHPFFDTRWTNWVGLVTHKPVTEDYVPLLPWLGIMCWGAAAGRWVLDRRRHWLVGALPPVLGPLAGLGRWSLSFYMLHQPFLFALLLLWAAAHSAAG
jgi:uncharacterized membrane protein